MWDVHPRMSPGRSGGRRKAGRFALCLGHVPTTAPAVLALASGTGGFGAGGRPKGSAGTVPAKERRRYERPDSLGVAGCRRRLGSLGAFTRGKPTARAGRTGCRGRVVLLGSQGDSESMDPAGAFAFGEQACSLGLWCRCDGVAAYLRETADAADKLPSESEPGSGARPDVVLGRSHRGLRGGHLRRLSDLPAISPLPRGALRAWPGLWQLRGIGGSRLLMWCCGGGVEGFGVDISGVSSAYQPYGHCQGERCVRDQHRGGRCGR